MEREIVLKIDGKEIMMNQFVQNVFKNVLDGLIDSLDKVPVERDREISIQIKNK